MKLKVLLECKEESESGHIWISILKEKYYIKTIANHQFAILSLDAAKNKFTKDADYDTNTLIQMT